MVYNCYIFNMETGERLQFFCPESISESIETEYTEETPLFSVGKYVGFESTGVRSPDIDFVLHEDLMCGGGGINNITDAVNFLKSLAYPEFEMSLKAPGVYVKVCNVSLYGYVTNVSIDWKREGGIRNDRFIMCDVSLSVTEKVNKRPTAKDIRGGYQG